MIQKTAQCALVLVLFVLLALGLPAQARAQALTRLATAEVDLWPEFDQPSVLVIYHIALPAQVQLPAELTLRIPSAAGKPNAVAARQPDASLLNLPYTQEDAGGGWSRLTFSATTAEVQIEYYDPGLTKDGNARHFEYHWAGDYPVDALTIIVQQPVSASQMRISPSMGEGAASADGLVYYTYQAGTLSAGQSFAITLDYQKSNDDLSAKSVPVQPTGTLSDGTAGWLTAASVLPWILGGLGVLLIGGGVIWYRRSGNVQFRSSETKAQRRPRTRASKPGEVSEEQDGAGVYCHQCGKRASPGDRFCRACGAELRLG